MYMVTYYIPYEGETTAKFATLEEARAYAINRLENDCMAEIKNLCIYKVELVEQFR